MTERAIKRERVRAYLTARGLAGVLLTTAANFAWLTAGAANPMGSTGERDTASLLITADTEVLIASDLETPRLRAEVIADAEIVTESYPWHTPNRDGIVRRYGDGGLIACDAPLPDTVPLGAEFAALRDSLLPKELERYRRLGRETALCVTRACFEARPGLAEHQIAGLLAGNLLAFGITPSLLLVGSDERARHFRYPLPTDRRVEHHLLMAVRGQRAGLTVSMTRVVHFGPLPKELRRCHDVVTRVDAALHHVTRPGMPLATVLAAGEEAASGEWRRGHPSDSWLHLPHGGPTGYLPRDAFAGCDSPEVVLPNQAFAWSPAMGGTRSEDTFIATAAGSEVMTGTPDLPVMSVTIEASIVMRPDILVR